MMAIICCRYVLFAVKRRRQIKVTSPGTSFSEVTKMLGQEWTNLHPDTKKVCIAIVYTKRLL